MRRRHTSPLLRVIRRSRSPVRKRSRERSFSISPSPPSSSATDRNLNQMRHASERIRSQHMGKSKERERSVERRRSSPDSRFRKYQKRYDKVQAEEHVDKREIVIDTNSLQEVEESYLDPSTCSFQATFKQGSPELNDISTSRLPKRQSQYGEKNKKHIVEPNFNYMQEDFTTKELYKDDAKTNLEKKLPKESHTKKSNNMIKTEENSKDDRITRLEKLVEVLVKNTVKPGQEEDLDNNLTISINTQRCGIPELVPSNNLFTTSMWLNRIHEICLEKHYDEKTSIEFVKSKMTGIIRSWFNTMLSYDFTWPEMRLLIIKTFPDNVDFATTLKLLVNRTKDASETVNQYYFSKLYLCECCKISGRNAVSCLIDGLNNPFTKQEIKSLNYSTPEALYSEYLSKYPEDLVNPPIPVPLNNRIVEESYESEITYEEPEEIQNINFRKAPAPVALRIEKKKCYTCGKLGHVATDCRHASVCYHCKKPGHIKAQCRYLKRDLIEPMMLISETDKRTINKEMTDCEVNGLKMLSIIDTGSSVVTIQENLFKKINIECTPTPCMLYGYGGGRVQALGEAMVKLRVHQVEAEVMVIIVPDEVQDVPVIIGQTFLKRDEVMFLMHKGEARVLLKDCYKEFLGNLVF